MARLLASLEGVDRDASARGDRAWAASRDPRGRTEEAIAGAIAICPAPEELLRQGLRAGRIEMRGDDAALDAWLGEHDIGRRSPRWRRSR